MLALKDFWVWDSWIADDGDRYHLFFLQAPRALGDAELRHAAARIGHASSVDLVDWTYHGKALDAGAPGAFDELSLWTGSTVRGDDGRWRMYYTGVRSGAITYEQRIGMVTSDDLTTWTRVDEQPVLQADPRLYQTVIGGASETFRDPFVFRGGDGAGWHMLVTARAPGAPRLRDGILAHATSGDLLHWEPGSPVSTPNLFGQLEVPQVVCIDGQWLLVFTCHPDEQDPALIERWGHFCTWVVLGELQLGPWHIDDAVPFTAEPWLFAAPLVERRDGSWAFVGFRNLFSQGRNVLEIVDPIPVELTPDGLQAVGAALR